MSIKLGIAPIAWSNDDMPELGGETTLEQCLSEASKAGFTGIESGGKFPKNSKELIPKLRKRKFTTLFWMVWSNTFKEYSKRRI